MENKALSFPKVFGFHPEGLSFLGLAVPYLDTLINELARRPAPFMTPRTNPNGPIFLQIKEDFYETCNSLY